MHIRLIAPTQEDSTHVKPLWAAILAAHTPPDVPLTFVDEALRPLDLARDQDTPELVGLSVTTKTAVRAYQIADEYRRRGCQVVLGGIHASVVPEEAGEHADAVVVGEAEGLWTQIVADARRRRLLRLYRHAQPPSLEGHPLPRRDLCRSAQYVPFDVVQTTRGCPYTCEFCSVSIHHGTAFRHRPLGDVLTEMEAAAPRILLADDNVLPDTRYGRELLEGIAPLHKTWVGQSSLAGLQRVGAMDLLQRSGCKALLVGFETVDPAALKAMGKAQNVPAQYVDVVRRLADRGIAVWGSFVLGFDQDTPDCVDGILEFCQRAQLTLAQFAMLTPYPGTRLHARLAAEKRLPQERWWLKTEQESAAPYFEPARMTRAQLRDCWKRAWTEMYSPRSMLRRYDPGLDRSWIQNVAYWPLNLLLNQLARHKIVQGDPRFRSHRTLRLPFGF